jgi:putative SOS response-associated peptidase YedK
MFQRLVIFNKLSSIETRFRVNGSAIKEDYRLNFNAPCGALMPVITQENPDKLQFYQFGISKLQSEASISRHKLQFCMQSGGEIHTLERSPPSVEIFQKLISVQRCLVVVSGYIEWQNTYGSENPHFVFLENNNQPFALAGLYESWYNILTEEVFNKFFLITTTANNLLKKIGASTGYSGPY